VPFAVNVMLNLFHHDNRNQIIMAMPEVVASDGQTLWVLK